MQLPDFDELQVNFFQLIASPFGLVGALTVAAYIFWKKIMSYVEAVRDAMRVGRQVRGWLARQLERQGGELWFAIVTTVAMLLVQAAWLASTFVIGNLISLGFGPRAATEGQEVPTLDGLTRLMRWDTITQAYVMLCLVAMVVSYVLAKRGQRPGLLVALCGLPGWLWGFVGGLGAILMTIIFIGGWDIAGTDLSSEKLRWIWGLVATGCLFLAATHAALNAPTIILRAWRGSISYR